jgi:pyruvate dehydrogenase E1 component
VSYVEDLLKDESGVFVAASDFMKALPLSIAKWVPGRYSVLGTDGFGLSESRPDLRDHFEVSADHIAYAAMAALADDGKVTAKELGKTAKKLGIDPGKLNPAIEGPAQKKQDVQSN